MRVLQGLLVTNTVTTILLGCVTVKVLSSTERPYSGQKGTQRAAKMGKNPNLVSLAACIPFNEPVSVSE